MRETTSMVDVLTLVGVLILVVGLVIDNLAVIVIGCISVLIGTFMDPNPPTGGGGGGGCCGGGE